MILLIGGILLSLLSGPVDTDLSDLWDFFINADKPLSAIILNIRLPRLILAFLVGACLSLSGAMLQGYFRNPMAGPFVVGVSSGASFGAVLALFSGFTLRIWGLSAQNIFAFASGFLLVSVVYLLSQKKGGVFRVETLLLTGIAAGALASSLTSFMIFFKADAFEQAIFWLLGSFALSDWAQIWAVLPYLLVSFIGAQWLAKDMNLLSLGDETAHSLGCPVRRIRKVFLILATLLASSAVSVSGIIGFVGLIIPHWVRLLIGPDHRYLFPFSALLGGIFCIYSDMLARTLLSPTEIPIGIITAAVGAPFFIYLLHKKS